jgi:hypothetical protein
MWCCGDSDSAYGWDQHKEDLGSASQVAQAVAALREARPTWGAHSSTARKAGIRIASRN